MCFAWPCITTGNSQYHVVIQFQPSLLPALRHTEFSVSPNGGVFLDYSRVLNIKAVAPVWYSRSLHLCVCIRQRWLVQSPCRGLSRILLEREEGQTSALPARLEFKRRACVLVPIRQLCLFTSEVSWKWRFYNHRYVLLQGFIWSILVLQFIHSIVLVPYCLSLGMSR